LPNPTVESDGAWLPAQPDPYEKGTLFTLLDADGRIGVKLTESFAMWPASSISGLYFSHPESRYFGIGKIERDQVEDYARRKHWSVKESGTLARAAAKLRSACRGCVDSARFPIKFPIERPPVRILFGAPAFQCE